MASSACVVANLLAGLLAAELPASTQEPADLLGEIVVTGSRLPVILAKTSAPVTLLSRRDLERSGADSLGKILQDLPINTGSPMNTNVNELGDGSVRADLRGLGPERTLVLLNGRRFPNSGIGADNSVDLNSLPLSWIERVEVLASGASAVYGADAVSGVINVVTRRDLDAPALGGSWTITERGDGEIVQGHLVAGFDLGEGSWSLGIEYARQDGVTLDRRSYSAVPLDIISTDGTVAPGGSAAVPEGLFEVPAGNALGLAPDIYTRIAGTTGQTPANYRLFAMTDFFNFAPYNYSQTPNERGSLWLFGSQPLGANVRLFLEGLVHRRESEQQLAPEPYFSLFQAGPTLDDGMTGIPAENHYNPFGVDLRFVTRRFVESEDRNVAEEVDLWRALIGLEGTVADWTWRVSVADAQSDATTVETGPFAQQRFVTALGPSGLDDTGRIVCGPPDPVTGLVPAASVIPGCVPLNVFDGAGTVTPEQIAYMSPGSLSNPGSNEQRFAEAILSGPWGQWLGRDLQWVAGAEYRREAGSLVRDPLRVLGFEGLVNADVPDGEFTATELFAELQLPLLSERPWARDLGLNIGIRWSDFSSFDENTSWQAGVHWQLTDEITVRANYAEVFRSPSLSELYEAQIPSAAASFDPCGNDPTPQQQVNCAADGVPGGTYVQGEETFLVVSGGNPDLEPETGHSVGAGLLYRPRWAPGLAASLDYFQIELTDFIGSASVDEVLFECAERGSSEVCAATQRFPDGTVAAVSAVGHNFGRLETRGIDLSIDWSSPRRMGLVNTRLLATYLEQWDDQPFPGGEVFERAGKLGGVGALPQWRAQGHIDWQYGPWRASYSVQFIGSYSERVRDGPLFGTLFDPFTREVDAAVYHDLEGGFAFDTGLALRAVISNVTDEEPPFVDNGALGNTDVATYPLLGRTFYLEARYEYR
jgi:outer membrane receptor protein involved in Fe transport